MSETPALSAEAVLAEQRRVKLPRIRPGVPDEVVALWKLPRREAENVYQEAFQRGDKGPLRWLAQWDRYFLLTCVLRRPDMRDDWLYARCREVEADPDDRLDLWARYHYKALALDTPVPTPAGWKRHGDLRPGDQVFGADGRPVDVLARTKVFRDADCYRVTFDKGYSVVCSGDHLWTVDLHSRQRAGGNRRVKRRRETIDTRQLLAEVEAAQQVKSRVFPAVTRCAPLEFPRADLPIDPYVFGVWLGDGGATGSKITVGTEDADELEALLRKTGITVSRTTHSNAVSLRLGNGRRGDRTSSEFTTALRALGAWGTKQLPHIYRHAAVEQRLALLQGLMDTDGHCDARGTATFVNTNYHLARMVFQVAAGLGLKPSFRRHHSRVNGEHYPFFHVSFQARAEGEPVFRLRRKRARANKGPMGRSAYHSVVSVEPVASEPCSCIQVDAPDGLYLVGEQCVPTHNSSIITFAGIIQEIVRDPEITIGIFSHTRPAAKDFLIQIKLELEDNATLKWLFPEIFWESPKKESPGWSEDGGLIVKRKSNPKEATVEAWGLVDGQPIGKHFMLRLYDDAVTEKSVTSMEMIQKTTKAYELSTNLKARHGRQQMVGTRYHYADTYGVLCKRGTFEERRYPASHDGTFDGEPVFLTYPEWKQIFRDNSLSTIAAQQLLNPIAGEATTFSLKWLKFWLVRPKRLNVYILCDPSKGRTETSDLTSIAVIGVAKGGTKFLLDGHRDRMSLTRRWQLLRDTWRRWSKMPHIAMVRVGYEQFGMQTDIEYFEERMRLENVHFPIDELAWPREGQKSKQFRIERLEPDFRNGRLLLPFVMAVDQEGNVTPVDPRGHKEAQAAIDRGEEYLIAQPIRKRAADGSLYDVLDGFLEEYMFFPAAPNDDFLDVMSRIYDMTPEEPVFYEHEAGAPMSLEPEVFVDGT